MANAPWLLQAQDQDVGAEVEFLTRLQPFLKEQRVNEMVELYFDFTHQGHWAVPSRVLFYLANVLTPSAEAVDIVSLCLTRLFDYTLKKRALPQTPFVVLCNMASELVFVEE